MPSTARELLEAPVPFVVGTTQEPSNYRILPTTAVLYIDTIINKSNYYYHHHPLLFHHR
jgi:hypothetical protein